MLLARYDCPMNREEQTTRDAGENPASVHLPVMFYISAFDFDLIYVMLAKSTETKT